MLFDVIEKGGWVIVLIIGGSMAAFAVVIERALYYRAADNAAREFLKVLNQSATVAKTEFFCPNSEQTLFERMWAAAARIPLNCREERFAAVEDVVRLGLPAMERNLYLLTTIATISPLLGLLGTVTGMIKVFQAATVGGMGNPQLLAAGVAEALYTTVAGLVVAIPCVVANNHFRSRVDRLLHWINGSIGEIVRRAGC